MRLVIDPRDYIKKDSDDIHKALFKLNEKTGEPISSATFSIIIDSLYQNEPIYSLRGTSWKK